MEDLKLAVIGPFNAGKSTVVKALSTTTSIHVDSYGTTIGLDYGYREEDNYKLHFFGAPGQKRFSFLKKEVILKGIHGVFVVIDSRVPASFSAVAELLDEIHSQGVPIIILANKQDLKGALDVEVIKKLMKIDCPIVPTVATKNINLVKAVKLMIKLITMKTKHKYTTTVEIEKYQPKKLIIENLILYSLNKENITNFLRPLGPLQSKQAGNMPIDYLELATNCNLVRIFGISGERYLGEVFNFLSQYKKNSGCILILDSTKIEDWCLLQSFFSNLIRSHILFTIVAINQNLADAVPLSEIIYTLHEDFFIPRTIKIFGCEEFSKETANLPIKYLLSRLSTSQSILSH